MICRICENSEGLETFIMKEMMFGLDESFRYFQCPVCGCLQIADIPADMSKYYPSDYYSYNVPVYEPGLLRSWLRKKRDIYAVSGKGKTGQFMNWLFPDPLLNLYSGLPPGSRILDVGCGAGKLIWRLKEAGMDNAAGIDPFIAEEIRYTNGLVIGKKSLKEVDGTWDLITWHHSFEHVPNPCEELSRAGELLADNGKCIVRIPVVDSWAWDHYKTDWVQIDAPRHFFLHSKKSIGILASKAGLAIERIDFDSTAFQFWGSEQIRKGIQLNSEKSYCINPGKSVFPKKQIGKYSREAEKLNRNGRGDQAVFYLKIRNKNSFRHD